MAVMAAAALALGSGTGVAWPFREESPLRRDGEFRERDLTGCFARPFVPPSHSVLPAHSAFLVGWLSAPSQLPSLPYRDGLGGRGLHISILSSVLLFSVHSEVLLKKTESSPYLCEIQSLCQKKMKMTQVEKL
ncbi:uncharacterized protein LOC115942586 isoform X6 [Leptonychotes weddellii]|uniref:Uncharacterized protein LOC115942586 isoform X6 n=1 Tax=Leptonychotes weddellii TaxID=9713 RepID=A0A7F8R6Y5_LEPWE|nr:uncharacterized protein LOC115942586 isoform X6 [Leptonychotes weddellii]